MPRPHEMSEDQIADLVAAWHDHDDSGETTKPIHEWLGWSHEDYANWVEQGLRLVTIDYTNYRGERSIRRIIPRGVTFDTTPYHPQLQWLLDAWDFEKDAERTFAIKDIHSWQPPA